VYSLLQPFPARLLAVAWVASGSGRQKTQLLRYQTEWRAVETQITGEDLKEMGLEPGPLFGRLLDGLRDARLDGKVSTRQDEETLLERLLEAERKQRSQENDDQDD
jgi:tRNA nucleotidyltransferase (CCA-adding enzyme)